MPRLREDVQSLAMDILAVAALAVGVVSAGFLLFLALVEGGAMRVDRFTNIDQRHYERWQAYCELLHVEQKIEVKEQEEEGEIDEIQARDRIEGQPEVRILHERDRSKVRWVGIRSVRFRF